LSKKNLRGVEKKWEGMERYYPLLGKCMSVEETIHS